MPKVSAHRRRFGQFFTPEAVVRCCYELLADQLPALPAIVDPACGDGAFLGYAAAAKLAPAAQLAGCDLDAALVAALHARGLAGVRCADGLASTSLPGATFDLVVGNPPFGVATSGPAAQASEVRFLQRACELARPGGLVVLVLPNGVLANERLHPQRADLLARCTVLAVIGLPRDTFRQAGTYAACSIVALRNAPAPPGHTVFFALAETLGQLPAVAEAWHTRAAADNHPVLSYSRPHDHALARRLDAQFWHPAHVVLLERMAARHPLRPLGELLDRRSELIAGDHVRPSRGEAKGPQLTYEYYQTREFLPAGYNYAQVERCDGRAYGRLRHTAVRRHDILVSCAGVGGAGRGRVCLITHTPGESCTGDVLIVRARRIEPVFLFLLLASRAGRAQLLRWQNGVGTVNLSVDELLQVQVPLLPEAEQRHLARRYDPVAQAHAAAMLALRQGDALTYQRERARSEALLAALVHQVERLVLGDDD